MTHAHQNPLQARDPLAERVVQAAEDALERSGSVGPLDVLMGLNWLYRGHVEQWQKGNEYFANLEEHFQSTPQKRTKVYEYFLEWVKERGLQPIEASYVARSVRSREPLRVTSSGNAEEELFFRTHYARPDISPRKTEKLREKLTKEPEIVVFIVVGKSRPCSECGIELDAGNFSVVEATKPLCLACADLDHLFFLPSGDATLTRRAKKLSPLSAVVVKFSKTRKRYERQGILVTEDAIEKAEVACQADAPIREARRERAALEREVDDERLEAQMGAAILGQFPNCPADEARRVAAHTARRGSGRVGRSAAGRALDPAALKMAVIAHIRHEHTNYDELLMRGIERTEARDRVMDKVQSLIDQWRG